ncbi:dipeptidyl-peptidase 3 family protein [Plebeiibacterium sediminum]|uniref:Dipeptidyl peptidase 3 n=1 Tax=Plebeiibacterium sediminum TaxID=2992112 RepID=A0AAE3M1U4_9BACT|nr:dihydrofolate reductase [Plebeiobacterium sediminum]MCW3785391.1 dipeptidyl peptidase 3 [Plebeiobacterium sediminum]
MEVFAEKFDDIKILRYEIPGFEKLELKKKLYIYYLSQATLAGRDILWDQHGKYNLYLRDVLEAILLNVKDQENPEWQDFLVYLKKVWFASGPHHHYSTDKFTPSFSQQTFKGWIDQLKVGNNNISQEHLDADNIQILLQLIFDPEFCAKRVNTNPQSDLITTSANNFYEGVNQAEVEDFYKMQKENAVNKKISFGLNSKLVKRIEVEEEVYKKGGLYGSAIEVIIENLEKAKDYTENEEQVQIINALVNFYTSGDLESFDEFNILWVKALSGDIDFINGFIETYGDPMGRKATWEGLVQIKDEEETKRAEIIAKNANWFEKHAPVDPQFKKDEIIGISLKAINAVTLGGDCYPASPLGINLPNAEWIREAHGSKSVTLTNISNAHHKASLSTGFSEEFSFSEKEVELEKKYGSVSDNLHTHLHECVGHGSGKMLPGVTSDSLKSFGSVIEETRADLYGLYYMYHPKAMELDLIPDLDAAKAHYNSYLRNGLLTQITRIKLGDKVEQAHMRNRQLISKWVFEKGNNEVVKKETKDGKTYFVIQDYDKLHELFGELLKEIQRIKSEGDYEAAKNIVEGYGVEIDYDLHKEVLERFEKLKVPPFTGFLNPNMNLVKNGSELVDVEVDYNTNYTEQMLKYSKCFNTLKAF